MMKKKLTLITNESFDFKNGQFYCDNIDLKSIPEGLEKSFDISIIGRGSKTLRTKKVDIKKIQIGNNILSYLYFVIKSLKDNESKYLIISISPFTFLACLILKIFFRKHFVYLRSDGFKEYKSILGFFGPMIYNLMFIGSLINANLISCREHLLKNRRGDVVNPSQLNKNWFLPEKKIDLKEIKLLYVGRIRVEKGIFSLMKIISNSKIKLTIVASETKNRLKTTPSNVEVITHENYNDSIIRYYDNHNIFILPSFTEAHPQVLDESLARKRPVIIFKEISHVLRNRKGIFISERNISSLEETINYIKSNYVNINEQMKKNILPTKKEFLNQLKDIILKD